MSAARSRRAAAAVGCALLLAGCATARFTAIRPSGGTVAIPRNTPAHREKALALMAGQCPAGYAIDHEGEFVTGETVTRERSTEFDRIREEARTTEERRSRTTVEWRITFTCR